jgi:hypothetical protein
MENKKDTLDLNYVKRKNTEIFKYLEEDEFVEIQNYLPIYNKFFALNEKNYNSVNFNNTTFLHELHNHVGTNKYIWDCSLKNATTDEPFRTTTFLKMAPVLDPFKYLIGKYDVNDQTLFLLPNKDDQTKFHPKIIDANNSAYIDGLFSFLSSKLIHKYNFVNGVDYYGSFLGIKNNFTINVADDLEYLIKSDFFNKNKGSLFQVDDYSFLNNLTSDDKPTALKPIKIGEDYKNSSIKSFNADIFDDLFEETSQTDADADAELYQSDLKDYSSEPLDMMAEPTLSTTLKSGSTCSSRSSYTSNGDSSIEDSDGSEEKVEWEDMSDESDESSLEEEYCINAVIPKFPVHMICMENCENTFDNLIVENDLTEDEWFAALMQIIMILITYQKAFAFTHNDLHTNNVMYNKTNEKWLYYCFNKKYYKVPTFGKIFKIIDFGRAIYRYDGKIFCSDSFQPGADAATQYNTEPYFNESKARIDPNFSFDLCRLACSIFDYVIDDITEIQDFDKCPAIVRLINEWCLDDNGINILYKNNGQERYPDFKLYKMIARCVHKHTPHAQLEKKEFSKFLMGKNSIAKLDKNQVINIDSIPCFI